MKALFCSLLILIGAMHGAEWTEMRVWTSTSGSKVTAEASSLTNGQVTLETKSGKRITLSIRKLVEADQKFLEAHFSKEHDGNPSKGAKPDANLVTGKILGPIEADRDSSYYLYIPESLTSGIEAPLLLWTGGGGGKSDDLKRLINGAETIGMILAVSVEAKEGGEDQWPVSLAHCKDCVRHITRTTPVDSDSIFYGGQKGGGAVAIHNAFKMGSAGTLTISGYISRWSDGSTKGHHFMAGPARCSSRYLTAHAAVTLGSTAMHWMFPGENGTGQQDITDFGLLWIYASHLYGEIAARREEKTQFEKRFLPWLKSLIEISPGEGLFFVNHLLEECPLSGEIKETMEGIQYKLNANVGALKYVKGRQATIEYSDDQLSGFGIQFEVMRNHITPKIEMSAKRLKKKYGELPELDRITEDLTQPTGG